MDTDSDSVADSVTPTAPDSEAAAATGCATVRAPALRRPDTSWYPPRFGNLRSGINGVHGTRD